LSALRNLNLSKCSSLQELATSIGQLNALQNLHLYNCSSLQKLPTSIGQLSALQNFDLLGCSNLQEWPTYWLQSKILIWTIVQTYKKYLHLLANWVHSKTLTFQGVEACKITYIYWPIECIQNFSFLKVFELAKITYVYWSIQCIWSLHLLRCLNLQKLPTSIEELNAF